MAPQPVGRVFMRKSETRVQSGHWNAQRADRLGGPSAEAGISMSYDDYATALRVFEREGAPPAPLENLVEYEPRTT
jgi:hypothetical protein